jgi:hypothetical protein
MNIIVSPSECGIICHALEALKSPDSEEIKNIYGMICDEVYLHFKNDVFSGDELKAHEYYSIWFDEFKLTDARYHL